MSKEVLSSDHAKFHHELAKTSYSKGKREESGQKAT